MAVGPINPTNITPPRVAFIDDRTGAISREWYRWLLSLFTQVEANSVSIVGEEAGPDPIGDITALQLALDASVGAYGTLPASQDLTQLVAALQALAVKPTQPSAATQFQDLQPRADSLAPVMRRLQDLAVVPLPQPYVAPTAAVNGIRAVSATTTVAYDDYALICDATGGAITVNLPTAASSRGRMLQVKKIDASANGITIDPSGAETIDDAATLAWTVRYQNYTIICDGSEWWVL